MSTEKVLIFQEVGQVDDMMSRFHVVIGLRPFGPSEQLSLWRTLISALIGSRADIEVEEKFLESTTEYAEERWNAREIQNGTWRHPNGYDHVELTSWLALETALSLAEYHASSSSVTPIVLRKEHLEEVASMFRNHKGVLRGLHRSDAGERNGYRVSEATSEEDS